MIQESLHSRTLSQCLLRNFTFQYLILLPPPTQAKLLDFRFDEALHVGIKKREKSQETLENATMWYIKSVVTKLFAGEVTFLVLLDKTHFSKQKTLV